MGIFKSIRNLFNKTKNPEDKRNKTFGVESYTQFTWQNKVSELPLEKRVSLAIPYSLTVATDADDLLLRFGEQVYEDMYKRDGISRIIVELLVSYIISGGISISPIDNPLVQAISKSIGRSFVFDLSNCFRWALIRGTSFASLNWKWVDGYYVPTTISLLPHARYINVDEDGSPKYVNIENVTYKTADGKETVDIPADQLLILKGIDIPDTPWGMSVYRPGWGSYMNRVAAKKAAVIYTEKLSIPHMLLRRKYRDDGTVVPTPPHEKSRLIKDLERMEDLIAIAEAPGITVEPLKLPDVKTVLVDLIESYKKEQIASVIGTTALLLEPKYGTYAQAVAQEPVMRVLIRNHAESLANAIQKQIYERAAVYNNIDIEVDINMNIPDANTEHTIKMYESAYKSGWVVSKEKWAEALEINESDLVSR